MKLNPQQLRNVLLSTGAIRSNTPALAENIEARRVGCKVTSRLNAILARRAMATAKRS